MFKSARWRTEKNKVKAVFKLKFHATQVSQVGEDSLMISLVPADVGKPTVRSEKAAIRDGSCYWENPVYETVKFSREPKTGKIHEKIYNFVVSAGSSKAGLVGEVSIDFASYAESIKLSSVSLPLHSDAVLHNGPLNKKISHIVEMNENHRESSGSDLTMSSSESSFRLDTPGEFGVENNNIHQNPTCFLSSENHVSMLQKETSDLSTKIHEEHRRSQWEWLGGSAPEASTDDSSSSSRDALSRAKSEEEAPDIVIEKLKTEIAALSRQAEMSELELQTLRKQIVKEGKRGQDLFREVVGLKEERDALKEECEKLNAFQRDRDKVKVKTKLRFDGGDPCALVEELREELNYEKELNANLRLQLQKTQESNSELILAVSDLDEMLEQKNREIISLSNRTATSENARDLLETNFKTQSEDDEEQKALEDLVNDVSNFKEHKTGDLYSDSEIYRRYKDELEVQMEQLALDYEILKQENHDLSYKLEQNQLQEQLKMQYECSSSYGNINELETQIENLETQLQNQSKEFADSLTTISKLETHIRSLEEELEKQAQGFEADLEVLACAKVEQEQRAILAEEGLRKMRWQNANTAERLQEEFRKLSVQMSSTFEENEKLATKALTEASELRLQKNHLEELLRKAKEELADVREQYEAKLHELSSQLRMKVIQIEQMQSEIEDRSKELEHEKTREEESRRILSRDMLILRKEIERLKTENNNFSLEAELRETLKGELETFKSQCNELKHSLLEDEFEKEKLRKQVVQLKIDLKKKEDAFSRLEKKLKDTNSPLTVVDGTKTIKSASVPRGPKEIVNLKDKIKMLKSQIKLKEAALETSTNSFLEKEKDLHNTIEELERRLEEVRENSANSYECDFQKVAKDSEHITSNGHIFEHMKYTAETSCNMACGNVSAMPFMGRGNEILPEKGTEASALRAQVEVNLDDLLNEIALLKEKNISMEVELKEMQERYSEISLKFAEVEGERQQLVMKVRNLKNAKKS
ncbi:hypothetical protein U1Q18_021254 [Sarracenia purpurea var. burkii]